MPDTLVDSPPAPTLRDTEVAARASGPNRRAALWIVAVVTSLVVLMAGAAALVYFRIWRYGATALRHVPGNANVVVRFELADIAVFGPVRKHLWPLLVAPSNAPTGKLGKPFAERLDERTGVDLRVDVREIVVASVDASGWIAIAGGHIAKGRFVQGLEQLAREEGWAGWHREGDVLVGPAFTVGQAEDGTLFVATDRALVTAALPRSEDASRFALPDRAPIAFALTREAWSGASGQLATLPHGWILGKVDRASGRMILGDQPELVTRIQPGAGADPAALSGEIDAVIRELRVLTLLAPDIAGEKTALGAATVTADGGAVVVHAPWPYEGLDRGCEHLARLLK